MLILCSLSSSERRRPEREKSDNIICLVCQRAGRSAYFFKFIGSILIVLTPVMKQYTNKWINNRSVDHEKRNYFANSEFKS